jgi:hypothetical protein
MHHAEISPLHGLMTKRFEEAFGKPRHTLGRDSHWSLRPPKSPALPINLLVNSTPDLPAVWLFDPNNQARSVVRTAIRDEAHLEKIISLTQERVQRAAGSMPDAPRRLGDARDRSPSSNA